MITWTIEMITLDLKYTWKISRNATDQKKNLIVRVSDGMFSGLGEAAPNIRYQETPELLLEQFNRFANAIPKSVVAIDILDTLFDQLRLAYALRFAIESAWHHFEANRRKIQVAGYLGVPSPGKIETAYTIPIMDPSLMKRFYDDNHLSRFRYVKLKINADEGYEMTRYLASFCVQKIMIDANEAFSDPEQCIYFLEKIKKLPIELVEQPLPSGKDEEGRYMKNYCPFPLFADESITHAAEFGSLKDAFDGVNIKLMKAGGYRNGISLLTQAKKQGMRTMIGCMVETTLGISSGMQLCALADYADLDSFLLVKDEPFRLINEENGTLRFNNTGS
ncbi:MAG TPA: dipeptide epimerase [Bacteroidia bacterium]|nr:dipeptide epimerase [Bacteroidia bacterium]